MLSLTDVLSSTPTTHTFSAYSRPSTSLSTSVSSTTTTPCELRSHACATSFSPTSSNSPPSERCGLTPVVQTLSLPLRPASLHDLRGPSETERPVSAGTKASVCPIPATAGTAMFVRSAAAATPGRTASAISTSTPFEVAHPRFLRNLVWDDRDVPRRSFVDVSLTHDPVPDVLPDVRSDPIIAATLAACSDLFKIVTPIKTDVFQNLLSDHPNQPFVRSVCRGLREGFWPYADEKPDTYPDTWDEVRPPLSDDRACQFLRDQRDEEIALDCYSPAFGTDLLPGMYSMPVHVVPKPHSEKL